MDKAKLAETPQEFINKYKNKRYTASNAGLCIILEYLYQLYRSGETDKDSIPEHLYTLERQNTIIQKAIDSGSDENIYLVESMQKLVEWLPTAFDSAITAREAAIMAIVSAMSDFSSLQIIANSLSKKTVEEIEATDYLQNLWSHCEEIKLHYKDTREYINNSLCFINAYNTLIEMIRAELSIPEFINYQVDNGKTKAHIDKFNAYVIGYAKPTTLDFLLVQAEPINLVPKPIPDQNLKHAQIDIKKSIRYGNAWSTALSDMFRDYWRRIISNG